METTTTAIVILSAFSVGMLLINFKKQWDISELKSNIKGLKEPYEKELESWKSAYDNLKNKANGFQKEIETLKEDIVCYKTDIQNDYLKNKAYRKQIKDLLSIGNGLKEIIQKQSAALELAEGELAKRLTERQYKKYSKERGAYNAELKREPNLEKYKSEYIFSDEYGKYKIEKVELSPREIEDGYIMKLERVYEPHPKNEAVKDLTGRKALMTKKADIVSTWVEANKIVISTYFPIKTDVLNDIAGLSTLFDFEEFDCFVATSPNYSKVYEYRFAFVENTPFTKLHARETLENHIIENY